MHYWEGFILGPPFEENMTQQQDLSLLSGTRHSETSAATTFRTSDEGEFSAENTEGFMHSSNFHEMAVPTIVQIPDVMQDTQAEQDSAASFQLCEVTGQDGKAKSLHGVKLDSDSFKSPAPKNQPEPSIASTKKKSCLNTDTDRNSNLTHNK